ncbi:hypothetical protein ABH968_001403 [Lysinibacillus sp. RC79]
MYLLFHNLWKTKLNGERPVPFRSLHMPCVNSLNATVENKHNTDIFLFKSGENMKFKKLEILDCNEIL